MKISVITPSYNQGRFLERTIRSVLEQDYPELEYIIMDGGSSDNSTDLLNKYAKSVSYIESKPDGGQANAVNKGIKKATGEIIGWLNSDDIYYPGTLQTVAELFQSHPEVNVVYGNADHIDEDDGFIEAYKTEPWNFDRLKIICFICQPAVFFRKSVCDQYGLLDENLNYCMDYEFWLRIGQQEKFYFLRRKLAGSRLYASNKTLGSKLKVHTEIVKMFKDKFSLVPDRWIAALSHFLAIEKSGMPEKKRELRKYLIKASYHWHKNSLIMNGRVMPKGMLIDLKSIVKVNTTAFHDRLDARQ